MQAHEWAGVLRVLLNGEASKYEEQSRFLQRALPYLPIGAHSGTKPLMTPDFKFYMKSFSYATQLYGPLRGVINLVSHYEGTAELLASFFCSYYKYIGRTASSQPSYVVASQESASWGSDDIKPPPLQEELSVLTEFDQALGTYQQIMGLSSAVGRVSGGAILLSSCPMDQFSPAYSAASGKSAGWEKFGSTTILDIADLYEDTDD